MTHVSNTDAARLLFNAATILELADDNPYRIRAYRRAARLLLARPAGEPVKLVDGRKGRELDLPGLGERLRRKLGELLSTGRMGFFVELCAGLPKPVSALMEVPGIGPKTARRLHEELGLSSVRDLAEAAKAGRIRDLYGFGPARERRLLEGALETLGADEAPLAPVAEPIPFPPRLPAVA